MRITLNLATRPYADIGPSLKLLRIAMAVLVVIGIGLGFGLHAVHQQAEEARKTEQQVQSKIDALNRERQGYQNLMRQPANDALLKQVTVLNQLIDEKTFSWTLAMEDLETVLPGGVQAISLDPVRDAKTGIITLKLRVVGPRDRAVDLVENLEHSKHFLLPSIVGESIESSGGPGERLEPPSASNRVNFELQAQYNPVTTLDHKAQQKAEKPAAAGAEHASHSAPPSHAEHRVPPHAVKAPAASEHKPMQPPSSAHPPALPGQKPMQPANRGFGRHNPNPPNSNPNLNPNPGGPR
jgi:type IV pilus assembly protein PilN